MTDDFEFVTSVRPDPRPDDSVTERHRRQLLRTMTGETGETGETGATGATGQAAQIGPVGATGKAGQSAPASRTETTGQTGATAETGPAGATGATRRAGQTAVTGEGEQARRPGEAGQPRSEVAGPADPYRRPDRSRPGGLRRVAVLVALAALVLGGAGVWVFSGEDGSRLTTGPAAREDAWSRPGPPTTAEPEPPGPGSPACGTEVPAALQVPGARGDPVVVPPAEAELPARADQLILRWDRPRGPVEVRWPAGPQPDYGFDEPERRNEPSGVGEANRFEFWAAYEEDASGNGPPADLVIDTNGYEPPGEGCTTIEVRVTGPDGTRRSGIDLSRVHALDSGEPPGARFADLGALVRARDEVRQAPTEADVAPCDIDGDEPPPTRTGEVTMDAQPEPVDALRRFLASAEADGLGDAAFTELLEEDGTITYATPSGEDDGTYVVLISVVPVEGGWVVDRWMSSGC